MFFSSVEGSLLFWLLSLRVEPRASGVFVTQTWYHGAASLAMFSFRKISSSERILLSCLDWPVICSCPASVIHIKLNYRYTTALGSQFLCPFVFEINLFLKLLLL